MNHKTCMSQVQYQRWSSPTEIKTVRWGWEKWREPIATEHWNRWRTWWKNRAVFMFSERKRKLVIIWNDPIQGEPVPPCLSNASLERMINILPLTLATFPPFPNQTLSYWSTDSATRQIKKEKVTLTKQKSKNKTTLPFSYICISEVIQPV